MVVLPLYTHGVYFNDNNNITSMICVYPNDNNIIIIILGIGFRLVGGVECWPGNIYLWGVHKMENNKLAKNM